MSDEGPPSETIECDDLEGFVAGLFGADPKPPNTVALDLVNPEEVNAGNTRDALHGCFRLLGQILTRGILYKYGNEVSLSELTPAQIGTLKSYMHSLGYEVWIDGEITLFSHEPKHQNNLLPWILKIRQPPGTGEFHNVMFCRLTQ